MGRVLSCYSILLLASFARANVLPRSLVNAAEFASQTFDYLVIGGGTAGLVVAARLSEDPKVTVGVIEAGQYIQNDPFVDTPRLSGNLQGNPKYDWMFETIPQPNLNNRVLPIPRGKGLGGSSMINLMVFDRASKAEYDGWSKLGNTGWNWDGLLPYMKKAESFTGIDPFRANSSNPNGIYPSQGRNGPIAASYNDWYSDIIIPCNKAIANLGIPMNYDPDSGNAYGHFNSATAVNRTTGKRSYAASTYFAYNAGRTNLVVLTGAQVTKINFANASASGSKLKATGVSFVSNSTGYSAHARKEVVLAAGAIQSPQILELSGIGNATLLQSLGIRPLINLPGVGENLQDHPGISVSYELKPGTTTFDILRNNATFAAEAQAQYNTTHDGIYAATNTILSFVDLETITNKTKLAAMRKQLEREIKAGNPSKLQAEQYAIQRSWLDEKLGHVELIFSPSYITAGVPKANTSYLGMFMIVQHPFSRGNVHIKSSDYLARPTYDPNYFSKTIDQDTLVEALKFSLKVSQTEPLASLIVGRQDPAPDVITDTQLLDYVKAYARTLHHPIGTVVLAPEKLGGVVGSNLKVYGTANLRVVDASLIPLHMGTHLSRTVYGIAEKAAVIIRSG
ncbi:GMC oxidoreductase [Ceratobasidium sp. AG-Ba]|nr:GMC oxidoreductase [Ceratobasidium sp. AG-Ba]QRV98574.1 GMC oxidoreductase [Ceratobasidium sp. AG-Ba]